MAYKENKSLWRILFNRPRFKYLLLGVLGVVAYLFLIDQANIYMKVLLYFLLGYSCILLLLAFFGLTFKFDVNMNAPKRNELSLQDWIRCYFSNAKGIRGCLMGKIDQADQHQTEFYLLKTDNRTLERITVHAQDKPTGKLADWSGKVKLEMEQIGHYTDILWFDSTKNWKQDAGNIVNKYMSERFQKSFNYLVNQDWKECTNHGSMMIISENLRWMAYAFTDGETGFLLISDDEAVYDKYKSFETQLKLSASFSEDLDATLD